MLDGELLSRQAQKEKCATVGVYWNCAEEVAGVKLRYLFMNVMDGWDFSDRGGFPYFRYRKDRNNDSSWTTGRLERPNSTQEHPIYYNRPEEVLPDIWYKVGPGNCEQDAQSCMEHFFEGHTERDILIFGQGLLYAWNTPDPSVPRGKNEVEVDYEQWLTKSAAAFAANLAATLKGQVFRFSLAEANSKREYAYVTPALERVNNILWNLWPPASQDRPWYTIDQWAINKGRHHMYEDYAHYNGPLTQAMLHQMLNELCPGGGKTTWLHPGKDRTLTQALSDITALGEIKMSATQSWYMVIHNGSYHNVPNMDTLAGLAVARTDIKVLHDNGQAIFPEGEPVPHCDPGWDAQHCKQTYYYKALHGLL